mgnify:CR=1 FL=1
MAALANLSTGASAFDIGWRMALCGAGFGLFQSPNNHTIVSSAPAQRSGGASGMLGTARLLGQSTGAALVALLLNQQFWGRSALPRPGHCRILNALTAHGAAEEAGQWLVQAGYEQPDWLLV